MKGCMDIEWQKAVNAEPEYIQECKTDFEILTQVIKQCAKSGKYVILTKAQWDGLHKILEENICGWEYFDIEYWYNIRPTKFFDVGAELRNWHCLYKYRDLFKSGIPASSDYEQWMQCVERVCDCSEEEILEYPLAISPPTISEEEWKKCAEVGFIGYDEDPDLDYSCPMDGCNKPISQPDHGDHKIVDTHNTMICFGCDKGLEPHHIRWQITLNSKQRQYLRYALRHLIGEYEQDQDKDKQDPEQWKIRDALELKLMKNLRHKLRSSVSGKILVDPYTMAVLIHCSYLIIASGLYPTLI
jgi:hypothetical protein